MRNWQVVGYFFRSTAELYGIEPPTQAEAPLFVLVHGTWGRGTKWVESGSVLVETLRSSFGGAGFARYSWHSFNGARARLRGAEGLTRELNKLSQYPRIVAVSHSHGGNVVAWAATAIETPLACSISLNTPFFHFGKRFSGFGVGMIFSVFFGTLYFIALFIYSGLYPDTELTLAVSLTVGMFGAFIAFYFVGRVLAKVAEPTFASLSSFYEAPRRITHELSVFTVGDEPAAALNTTMAMRWLAFKLPAYGIIPLILARIAVGYFEPTSVWLSPEYLRRVGLYALVLLGALAAFVAAVLTHGFEQAVLSVGADIGISPSPRGTVDALTVGWPAEDEVQRGTIHSGVYQNPAVARAIAAWIRTRLPDAPSGAAAELKR